MALDPIIKKIICDGLVAGMANAVSQAVAAGLVGGDDCVSLTRLDEIYLELAKAILSGQGPDVDKILGMVEERMQQL